MYKMIFLFTLFTMAFAISNTIFASEPSNLRDAKNSVVNYYDSGEYIQDVNHVVNDAMNYMETRINVNDISANAKLAIVLDIDETALSGYNHLKSTDFSGNVELCRAGEMQGNYSAMPAVLGLYHYAKKYNVAVFFVTGRIPKEQKSTEQNLKNVGYTTWEKIYFKPENYGITHKSVIDYKSDVRKQIEKAGYDIILNIGDQDSDLAGGNADKAFKLPNPFYRIP